MRCIRYKIQNNSMLGLHKINLISWRMSFRIIFQRKILNYYVLSIRDNTPV